jgi:hypothetical protein
MIRNHGSAGLPIHAVPVAGHGDAAAGTKQGYSIGVSPDLRGIAVADKGRVLTVTGDDDRGGA